MTYNLIMYLGDQSRSFSGTKANGQNAMTEWTYNAVYNSIMGMLLYEKRQHRKKVCCYQTASSREKHRYGQKPRCEIVYDY